ncbi:hypothetical protein SODALDRAFT_155578 [Sodiomyces alkalinus F11]|uniref:Uncharacterized protein n=1 Tax=Sodiomyces alkalinus (strain CBS 110278 / VKM F-3762 / F11) TaxID=1314773 RepID=A0A3N2PXL3_SODAK|nr:hypothetical protein SODALDRAFT_155578 [Sodiomyces alkalinus F11]ROT39251.1 hypothetical protein SODALDRAFT_155578 [Sodiomyces alkalinus F11]
MTPSAFYVTTMLLGKKTKNKENERGTADRYENRKPYSPTSRTGWEICSTGPTHCCRCPSSSRLNGGLTPVLPNGGENTSRNLNGRSFELQVSSGRRNPFRSICRPSRTSALALPLCSGPSPPSRARYLRKCRQIVTIVAAPISCFSGRATPCLDIASCAGSILSP